MFRSQFCFLSTPIFLVAAACFVGSKWQMFGCGHINAFHVHTHNVLNPWRVRLSSYKRRRVIDRRRKIPFGAPLERYFVAMDDNERRVQVLKASSPPLSYPPPDIAVSLDRPVFARASSFSNPGAWISLAVALITDLAKTATVAAILAVIIATIAKSSFSLSSNGMSSKMNNLIKLLRGRVVRIVDRVKEMIESRTPGVPMEFAGEGGWGKCTLESKQSIGESSFVRYDFSLPRSDHTLPLQLGQKLDLCCLDENHEVANGAFFLFSPRSKKGGFSIVAPYGTADDVEYALGMENAVFANIIKNELKVGDEVAIKCGEATLAYTGEYLPVTDIVFVASGSGIVPILDQIKSILPRRSSSTVRNSSVIWINENPKVFDLAYSQLENEFYKYSTKLEVSCCVENIRNGELENYEEVKQSIPDFTPGTMAVVAGPPDFLSKSSRYLRKRGYPLDCICILPP